MGGVVTDGGGPCVFGEVLFDVFPTGQRVLGGAPFNVAWHLQAFGLRPRLVSRVGEDADGDAIRHAMQGWGMDTSGLQTDAERPTGRVTVRLEQGEPHYEILDGRAWDAIDAGLLRPTTGELLYHGSLAVRSAVSARALRRLREGGPAGVFMDVNLRDPWWQRDAVLALLEGADWAKLNEHELAVLGTERGDTLDQARAFRERHGLHGLLVTCGAKGALAVTADGEYESVTPRAGLAVVDTVGAGDAFAAVSLLGLVRGWPLAVTLTRAQSFAEQLVTRRGATVADRDVYRAIATGWSG